ncbi:sugar ABC transporter permease [Spongiactinospora sp. TRM90649]|uniref:carbohydrate ABC transporter permease n=1 Tax=Spongiactinospora sp. TRM90649 TaxID=3031114 RepID=UPI0023F8C598|nr:sugar ABC transporter permease [Spongiactinospora sp. TRM90649]MDF5751577.1 sugar ABC transporter permease [Spongiactinospora sp. TRM90649]
MRHRPRAFRALEPLAWVGPAVVLIALVVIWPVIEMIRSSFLKISRFGVVQGGNGTANYDKLFAEPDFAGVMYRSLIWVVAVVGLTVIISLCLAQLFNQRFPGRTVARWALIAPWAASVLMTAIIFKWMLDPEVGMINMILHDLGVIDAMGGASADPLGDAATAMPWLIFVAVFVSVPFTTYALIAGLSTIPGELYEAAKIDGASKWKTYWSITFPLLRPALTVAALINVMNVFNSFPIIWAMTHGQPGYSTATSTIFMFILKNSDIGESAAMSVVNFGMVIILTAVFLRVTRWRSEAV